MQLARRQDHSLAHPAVAHHAERQVLFTAVGVTATAGVAVLTVDVGLHRTAVSRLYIRHAFANGEHLDAEFVPRNTRVAEEGHLAQKTAVVRAANANAMDADERVARARRRRLRNINAAERLRFFELNGFHERQ